MLFAAGQEKFDDDRMSEALADAKKCLGLRKKILHPFNITLGKTYDCIGEMLAVGGKYDEAAVYVGISVGIVGQIFGEDSVELTHELVKLAELDANRSDSLTISFSVILFDLFPLTPGIITGLGCHARSWGNLPRECRGLYFSAPRI